MACLTLTLSLSLSAWVAFHPLTMTDFNCSVQLVLEEPPPPTVTHVIFFGENPLSLPLPLPSHLICFGDNPFLLVLPPCSSDFLGRELCIHRHPWFFCTCRHFNEYSWPYVVGAHSWFFYFYRHFCEYSWLNVVGAQHTPILFPGCII